MREGRRYEPEGAWKFQVSGDGDNGENSSPTFKSQFNTEQSPQHPRVPCNSQFFPSLLWQEVSFLQSNLLWTSSRFCCAWPVSKLPPHVIHAWRQQYSDGSITCSKTTHVDVRPMWVATHSQSLYLPHWPSCTVLEASLRKCNVHINLRHIS